jgi:hypothetical protein
MDRVRKRGVASGSGKGEKWIMKPAREKGPERGGKKIVIGILS